MSGLELAMHFDTFIQLLAQDLARPVAPVMRQVVSFVISKNGGAAAAAMKDACAKRHCRLADDDLGSKPPNAWLAGRKCLSGVIQSSSRLRVSISL